MRWPTRVRRHDRRQVPAAGWAPRTLFVPDIADNGSPATRTRLCAAPTTRRRLAALNNVGLQLRLVARSVQCRARQCARLRLRVARIRRQLRRHRVQASGRKTSRQDRHLRVNDCADHCALADPRPRAQPSPDAGGRPCTNDLARAGHCRHWIAGSANPVLRGANDATSSRCARRCRAPASPVARSVQCRARAASSLTLPEGARAIGPHVSPGRLCDV